MRTAFNLFFATVISASALPALAASGHDAHGGMGAMGDMGAAHAQAAPMSTALVEGVVKKIDKTGGKVTLAHGPLTNLGMSTPMTMAFRVKDPSWLGQMKEGDKIRFAADNVDGQLTIVQFERAK